MADGAEDRLGCVGVVAATLTSALCSVGACSAERAGWWGRGPAHGPVGVSGPEDPCLAGKEQAHRRQALAQLPAGRRKLDQALAGHVLVTTEHMGR